MTDLLDRNLPSISIGGVDIQKITYRGSPVVTFAMVDRVHQRADGTAGRNFRENRERFVEGDDFVELTSDEIRRMSAEGVFPERTARATVLTQRGYLKLTKPMNDDRAWQVQGEMVDSYFAAKLARLPTTAEAFANVFQMVADQQRRHAEQDQQIKAIDARVDLIEDTEPLKVKPQNTETLSEIRKRINRKHGLPIRIINEVMGGLAYSPRAFAMVKNSHADAKGSSFAVWRIIDVTKLFVRFVGECTPATATTATHKDIEGRFKLTGKSAWG